MLTWGANLDGALNLDYRQKRGVGFGPDFHYDLGRLGQGEIQLLILQIFYPSICNEGMYLI